VRAIGAAPPLVSGPGDGLATGSGAVFCSALIVPSYLAFIYYYLRFILDLSLVL
jgi:hypothetical protein